MALKGFFSFDGLTSQESGSTQKNKRFTFNTGWIQIDKNWLSKINYKSFLLFHKESVSHSYKNISESISPENAGHFKENISADFFFRYIKNTENPISFAIYYDEVKQTIHIARNAFGTIPLFYLHIPDKFFAFATDIPALMGMEALAPYLSINPKKINAYLSRKDYALPYTSPTYFTHIHSILPGHIGKFTSKQIHQEMYVNYQQDSWETLKTADEFGETFKEIFLKSVNREISDQTKIGSHLSGGLDSSSVSSVIKYLRPDLELHTFYTDTLTELANETVYSQEVANTIGSSHHSIYSQHEDLDSLILSTSISAQPFYGSIGPSLLINLYRKASELGCGTVLTGHDGDSVVGNGAHYVTELFVTRNWKKLKNELSEIAKQDKFRIVFGPEWESYSTDKRQDLIFQRYFDQQLSGYLKKMSVKEVTSLIYSGYKYFGINPYFFFQSGMNRMNEKWKRDGDSIPTYIQSNELVNLGLHATNLALYDSPSFETQNESYRDLCYNQNVRVSEEQFAIGQHFNINVSHPFFDLKLYDLCQSIPAEILFDHGRGRGPLRTAMKKILPESVRNRTSKAAYNTYARQQTIRLHKQSQDFLVDNAAVWNYVNKTKFQTAAAILEQDKYSLATHSLMTFFVSRTIHLAIWLETIKEASL